MGRISWSVIVCRPDAGDGKRGKWEDKPMLCEIPDEGFQRSFVEPLTHPVEGGAEIVDELFTRICFPDLTCKASRFFNARIGGLEPEQIGIRSELDRSFRGRWESGTVMIEAFPSPGNVPREENRGFAVAVGKGTPS